MRPSGYKLKIMALLSALLVVLVLCSSLAIYFVSAGTMREQTMEWGHNALSQLQVSVETVLDVMNYSLIRAALEPDLISYADDLSSLNIAARETIYKRLTQLRATSKYIDKLYVYYDREQMVIDMNTSNPRTVALHQLEDQEMLISARSRCIADRYDRPLFIYNLGAFPDSQQLTMVMPVGGPTATYPRGVIVATLSQAYMRETLSAIMLEEDANVYILDGDGAYLAGTGQALTRLGWEEARRSGSGERMEAAGEESYLVAYTTSGHTDWLYVYEVSEATVFGKVNTVTALLVIIILLACLFAALGTRLVAGLLYRPVREIVNTVSGAGTLALTPARDEIDDVNQRIKALISQKNSFEQMLIENRAFLRDNFLQNLIRGQTLTDKEVLTKLEYYQVRHLPGAYYGVCVISVDRLTPSAEDGESETGTLSLYLRELISACFRHENAQMDYVRSRGEDIILFVSIAAGSLREAVSLMDEQMQEVLRLLSEELKAGITIGVGSLDRSFSRLALSYKQAKGACQYRIIVGDSRIIWHSEIKTLETGETAYPFKLEKEVFHSLKSGDPKSLSARTGALFQYFKEAVSDHAALRHMLVQLLNDTIQLLMELSLHSDLVFGPGGDPYNEVLALHTIDNAHAYFMGVFLQITEVIRQKKEDWREDVKGQIITYLDTHYASEDISLSRMAEEMHYSPSYLQKVFKNATGMSIREYIIEKRIGVAQELLSSQNIKIVDLADQVGYPNVRSFINIYKKYTGETPGEYKQRIRGSEP